MTARLPGLPRDYRVRQACRDRKRLPDPPGKRGSEAIALVALFGAGEIHGHVLGVEKQARQRSGRCVSRAPGRLASQWPYRVRLGPPPRPRRRAKIRPAAPLW